MNCIERIKNIRDEISTVHGKENLQEMMTNPPDKGDELDHLLREIVVLAYDAGEFAAAKRISESGWRKRVEIADNQARKLAPVIKEIIRSGKELNPDIADELNDRGIKTRNGYEWAASTVRKLRVRIKTLSNDKNTPSRE